MKLRFLILIPLLLAVACGPGVDPEPGPKPTPGPGPTPGPDPTPEGLPSVSTFKLGTSFVIPFGKPLHMPYSGFAKGDKINITARWDSSVSFELVCQEASDETGATFSALPKFLGGMCNVSCSRFSGGESFVDVVDSTLVDKVTGKTTYGRVIDLDGKPVEVVVVSDGALVTVTDAKGCYALASQRKLGYVFISVPGGYRVAVNRTIPQFFRRFTTSSNTQYECINFILEAQ